MTKVTKALLLGAALTLAAGSAMANDMYSSSRGQRGWIDNGSARAPQVMSTRAGNPHGDEGRGYNSTIEARSEMQNNKFPSAPRAHNAYEISEDTTRSDFPHRDPANANSAYMNGENASEARWDSRASASRKMALSRSQIREVQEELNDEGYRVAEDGVWGPQTANAVRKFQARNDLNANGKLNNETLRALDVSFANNANATYDRSENRNWKGSSMRNDASATRSGDERRWNKNAVRNDATTTDQRNPSQMDRTPGASYNDKNWENTQR